MKGRRALALCVAGVIGWALGYGLPIYGKLPSVIYDPQHRAWLLGARTGTVPMGYYGQLGYALVGAALAVGLVARWPRGHTSEAARASAPGSSGAAGPGLWAAWMLTALGVVGAFFTWNNWP